MTEQKCKNCIYAGSPYTLGDHEVVDCRIDAVTTSGFPITNSCAWCGRGILDVDDAEEEAYDPKADMNNYISSQQQDGTVLTLYIPDAIMALYFKVKTLEAEVEYLKRRS